jgi:hypothetical protein
VKHGVNVVLCGQGRDRKGWLGIASGKQRARSQAAMGCACGCGSKECLSGDEKVVGTQSVSARGVMARTR